MTEKRIGYATDKGEETTDLQGGMARSLFLGMVLKVTGYCILYVALCKLIHTLVCLSQGIKQLAYMTHISIREDTVG